MMEDVRKLNEKARALQSLVSPDVRELIEHMKGQLLIVLVNRLGGEIKIPVGEIDGTVAFTLSMAIDGGIFTFKTERKQ